MSDLKIKVCGMREADNIAAVAALPIDFMGFIFYEKSPRFVVNPVDVPQNVRRVGVFVNADIDFVLEKTAAFALDAVQLHGQEAPQYLAELRQKMAEKGRAQTAIWKAFSVDETFDFDQTNAYAAVADLYLFDTKSPQHGGAGVKFDWSILEKYAGEKPFFLAGGISADDAELVKQLTISQLYGLDLNSKFENAPADKNVETLRRFLTELKA